MLKQALLGAALVAGTLAVWLTYVPSAGDWLRSTGLPEALGIETAQAAEAGPVDARRGSGATRVIASPVTEGTLNDRVTAVGDGRALRSVTVRAEATGRIVELAFEAGSHVAKGSIMARLDDDAEQIALDRARLMLSDAQEEVERLATLRNTGAVTAVDLREAELALRNAELEIRQAEFDLSRRVILAPISGWIGILEVERGDRVSAQDELALITDRSQLLIDFRVPERVIGMLHPGMSVELSPLADRNAVLHGEVAALDNIVERASRTLRVQARIDNSDDSLRAGMAFSVLLRFEGAQYPSINPLSVQWSSEGSFVWAVRDGKSMRVPVVIRQRNSDTVLVEAALAPGDMVVTEGVQTLRPGAEVNIAGTEPSGAAQTSGG